MSAVESRYSAYDLELLAVYSTILKFRHVLEGRKVKLFTGQKLLTSAFFKVRDPASNRQRHQLTLISEFVTDVAHVPGLENVVADTLSRQFDKGDPPATVQSVVHSLVDVDLPAIARAQRPIDEEPLSSLRLARVRFLGVETSLVCDTSQGRPRILVPGDWRWPIFDAVHGLAHPYGRAMLMIVSRVYAWQGMRRDILLWSRECQACQTSKVAVHTKPPVVPIHVPQTCFEHIHVDLVGPFSPDRGF